MAHPDVYADFSRLQTRYWSLLLRIPLLALVALPLAAAKDVVPTWLYTAGFLLVVVTFIITWFQGVATYFRAMNWRCPDCQQRFAGLRVGIALMNSILIQRYRHCGSKPDFNESL